ncbi:fibronectin type III and SPRY domain-containing protein 2 isoform X1 [Pseudonaja textilis]|uniref:fibronectin type III and SPRY domain-containing protein 2 isoform X1 n=1 Tax=Pseudonaja textilis TaxID=8673 RepID=UPI000EA93CFA|nr:fibronectin type III and SPRY domain-containing protein 2 isoform X1 [Pseudonaja textilis]
MDAPLKKDEPDSPRFYHLELYDSLENLFPEEPFRRRDLSPHEKKETPDVEEQHPPHVEDRDQQPTDHAKENNEKSDSDLLEDKEASQRSYQEKELYCITCCVPVTPSNSKNNEHQEHEVMSLAAVVEIAKDALQQNIGRLEDQIAHLESFASHLEEIFITVEENFTRQQQNFEKRYDDIIQILEQRYEENMQALGEEKKEKLEALYKELVDCGENLDTCKELMETIENLDQGEKKIEALKTAVATIQRVHTFLKKNVSIDLSTPAEFEDRIIHFSDIQELLESVSSSPTFTPPCAPVMNAQDPNSATGTSVKVCWSFFSEDIVESYQLYYKRVSNDTSSKGEEEFKLNVKETYCTVAQLLPNTQYEFWVKAVNRAGVSSESERAVYMTAPLPPVIKKKAIQSCEYFALVQWECGNTNPVDSYTVELSKVAGGDGGEILTESVVGIPNCETLIQLEPKQSYLLFVKALNIGGSSERSEPASILSTGTVFTLNEKTAHPLLSILEDGLTLACHETKRAQSDTPFGEDSFTRSIAALGYPIPFRGKHYWEVDVDENTEYCIGVAFENVPREDYLGKSHSSWCMKHTITSSSHLYEFLNNGMTPDIKITVPPEKIGLLLDYDEGILSFFNADIKQHLHTFHNNFQDFVCPCFAMEGIGVLRIRNGITVPPHIVL